MATQVPPNRPARDVPAPPMPARPMPPRALPPRSVPTPVPLPVGRVARPRPDPTGLRLAFGLIGVAGASAMATAVLAPMTQAVAMGPASTVIPVGAGVPAQHVTRYVQLLPGQTAPPQALVQRQAAPTPRIVTITTRQSGAVVP